MFTCLWQLWDWLETPPLFTTTMESKKLQQFQQANSHLAPQPMPQKKIPSFHSAATAAIGDYHPSSHSPVFQSYSQYTTASNFPQLNQSGLHHQQPLPSTSQISPAIMDNSPQSHLLMKSSSQQNTYQQQQQQKQQQQTISQYNTDQLYQPAPERTYHHNIPPPSRTHFPTVSHTHSHPAVTSLQQQYQQLQQAKIQAQIQTQNEALAQQQRTFALRQQLNPPIPQPHYHMQSPSLLSTPNQQPQVQQQSSQSLSQASSHRNIPPSTLNLSTQFQPAPGPVKMTNIEVRSQHYHKDIQSQHLIQTHKLQSQTIFQQNQQIQQQHHQQQLHQQQQQQQQTQQPQQQHSSYQGKSEITPITPGDHGPVYIQQNHPGHVVNQACQTQLSGAIGSKAKTPSDEQQKSPSHPPLDRKKSSGTIQLKSPITKRPPSSPVTISGWLYKQGSEGLKVWRKRWFVLSEYCLYYYKGPEEEKLLGSILLPSYRVAACSPEDKIYRKYAFKCEHTNMRTYWLAAENAETMGQWVRALTAATMMQGSSESDQTSQPSVSSLNHSGENSDSGIHTFQSQQSKLSIQQGPVTPASDSGGGGGTQPLYANAPPKPRRVNDGGYSSPSPENSIDRNEPNNDSRHLQTGHNLKRNDIKTPLIHQTAATAQHHAIYDTRTGNVMSAVKLNNSSDTIAVQLQQMNLERNLNPNVNIIQNKYGIYDYGKTTQSTNLQNNYHHHQDMDLLRGSQRFNDDLRTVNGSDIYGEREIYMQRMLQQQQKISNQYVPGQGITYPNTERRTPDAYGRSKTGQVRPFSDYEDIYNLGTQQQQQQQQHHQKQLQGHHQNSDLGVYRRPMSPPTYNNSKHVPPMPSRYTPNHLESQVNLRTRTPTSSAVVRPHSADFLEYEARAEASSIKPDPVRAPRPKSSLDINRASDNYYYSEASYAEKMRQSALYLQKPHNQQQQPQQQQQQQQQQPQQQQSVPVNHRSSHDIGPSSSYSTGMNTISYDSQYEKVKRIEMLNDGLHQNGALSVPRSAGIKDYRNNNNNNNSISSIIQQNEQFLRSASARLPRKDDDNNTIKDGERKREESMKRLLEWKQRMLQSPLTRKGVQQNINQSQQCTSKLASSNPNILSSSGIQRSRSESHANAGYNSYSSDDEASISVHNVRNIPKTNLTVKPEITDSMTNLNHHNNHHQQQLNKSGSYYGTINSEQNNYYSINDSNLHSSESIPNFQPLRKANSRAEIDLLERETSTQIRNLDVSAGQLLSRTHEELVLLLIQLRRQNTTTARAIEQCCTDIHDIQNRIRISEGPTRSEHIQRLDYLKQHLIELEKQYEKSKPLVNLVDNMVKLGSLYRNNENNKYINQQLESTEFDRLEFNHKINEHQQQQQQQQQHHQQLQQQQQQQRRHIIQQEHEQKQWDRLSPNHTELQSKVRQLYQLDQLLQQESGTLQSLQRDKEDLERALGGLRARLQDTNGQPIAIDAAKKQQHILERELSRVHQLLAENSKKLEQTVAGNARLEQELLVLRQKLQASRNLRGSQGTLSGNQGATGDNIQYASNTTALLESELRRVQQLVGDMQKQRQELSHAVRQLTENSNSLYQQIGKSNNDIHQSSHIKRRQHVSCWTETDLDTMIIINHTASRSTENLHLSTPLYVDTNSANSSSNFMNCSLSSKTSENDLKNHHRHSISRYTDSDGMETSGMDSSDDLLDNNTFSNLTNQERQEIKTVRIVKRESERRQRDRERSGNISVSNQNLDQVLEEDGINNQQIEDIYSRSKSLPRSYNNDTYESIKQIKERKNHHPEPPKSLPLQSTTIPTNKRYSDYFPTTSISSSRPYPVSMTEKNYYNIYGERNNKDLSHNSHINSNYSSEQSSSGIHINNNEQNNYTSTLKNKTESMQSLTKSITDLSPVFQSEAAKQILIEMSGSASEDNNDKIVVPQSHKHKRAIPKEKRRHYTAPNNVNIKAIQSMQSENDMNRNNTNWRARDDLDMEVALRPRINAPDVVRSALGQRDRISENTIDKLLAAPSKILIPERYIPEQAPELSPEEKKRRQEKVEVIKKMLSEAPMKTSNDPVSSTLPPSKINAEKKQREHLLQLNQILAQQVMQMSKIVAGNPSQSNQK